jgi:hypothetical protein
MGYISNDGLSPGQGHEDILGLVWDKSRGRFQPEEMGAKQAQEPDGILEGTF